MMDEDLTVFFEESEFSDKVTKSDGSFFQAIFDEAYFDPEAGQMVLDTNKPRLSACRESDLTGVVYKSVLTVKNIRYSVLSVEPDGTGTAMIQLTKTVPPSA